MAEESGVKITEPVADNKYGMLPQDMVTMLKNYEHEYFREDKPVPFCGLFIYPVQIRYFELFSNCLPCLTMDKNEDIKGIKMSHLDYLISRT